MGSSLIASALPLLDFSISVLRRRLMSVGDTREPREAEMESLGELLRRLSVDLSKILSSFRIPLEDGEDLIQNVALQFVRKRRHVRVPEPWIRGALRHECRMYWRTRNRARTVAVDEAVLTLLAGTDPVDPEREALRHGLHRFIAALPWNCRSLLRMRYSLGLDVKEMAEKSGYKLSSIDKVTRRCVQKLTRKLTAAAWVRRGAGA